MRAGRTVTVVSGECRAFEADGAEAGGGALECEGMLIAIKTGTMMAVRGRPGLQD